MNWTLLQNSLLVAGLTTVGAVTLGFLAALSLGGLESRGRQWLLAGAVVALALPPFLVTNCWMHFLGYTGVWREWLPLNIYSLGGTVWILTLLTWPITLFVIAGAWDRLEPSQLESDVALQGWPLVRWLLFPLARPALGLAVVLTFVLALHNFAVPALLQTKVFPAELWVNFNTTFSYWNALYVGWPFLVAPLLLLMWLGRRGGSWPSLEGRVTPRLFRRQLGKLWFSLAGISTVLLLLFAVGLPMMQLLASTRTWLELLPALAAGKVAIWHSLLFAAIAATVCLALGLVSWRGKLGSILWLPFLLPGVLLGIVLIFLLNRPGLTLFYQSMWIVILGFTVRYLAISWSGAGNAMRSIDPDLTDSARLFGASGWQMFRHVYSPQIGPQLAAIWYVTYLLCLWDVETLVLIVPPGGETLALRIFNLLHYGHNAQVNALCMVLLGLAIAPLLAWRGISWVSNQIQPLRQHVAQIRNLPYRRIAFCGPPAVRARRNVSTSCRLQIGDTAECNSALRRAGGASREDTHEIFGLTGYQRMGFVAAAAMFLAGCHPLASNEAPVKSQLFERVQIVGSRGTALGQFNKPRSVAVDALDNLYVVDMTGRVQKFSSNGVFLSSWQMPETDKGRPKGMCRDAAGNVVVIEPHYSRVNHFTTDGKLMNQWGIHGTNAGQVAFPRAAAVNSRGEIYVSEYGVVDRVQKFSPDGVKLLQFFGHAGSGHGEFNRPEGLGLDAQGRLFVADSCNHRVQIFSADGQFLRSYGRAGTGPGEFSYPYDVQVDSAGRQYVCEFGNSRIQILDEQNRPIESLGGIGAEPGQFANPWGLALDSAGNLYVADSRNHRVQKFIRNKRAQAKGVS
jgi:ABC-type Fe3+ transport system permease subunit